MFSGELYNRDTTLFLIKCPTGVNIDIPLPKGKGFGWYNDADRSAPFYTSFPKDLTESMTLRKATVQEFPDDENMFAEGKSGNVSWNIDLNGKLTITGTGNYELTDIDVYDSSLNETYVEKDVPEWMKYASYIESATVGISGITTTKNMFKNCTNLKSINLSGLDTSKVTDMSGMFDSCNSLVKADVSGFDTSHVTTAGTMFGNCNSLKKLDLSGCDFSGLKFENSYDMEETDTFGLWSCTSLEEIRCKKLKKITIGAGVTTIGKKAFAGCKNIKNIIVKSKSLKKIGKNAFKGINKMAKIKVPKNKLKVYKKLFKKAKLAKSIKVTK